MEIILENKFWVFNPANIRYFLTRSPHFHLKMHNSLSNLGKNNASVNAHEMNADLFKMKHPSPLIAILNCMNFHHELGANKKVQFARN